MAAAMTVCGPRPRPRSRSTADYPAGGASIVSTGGAPVSAMPTATYRATPTSL